jgi:spore maturation protein CgeB
MTSAHLPSVSDEPSADGVRARNARGRRAIVVCDQWLGSNGYAAMKALRRTGWSVDVAAEWEFIPVRWRSKHMRAVGRMIRAAAVREFNAHLLDLTRNLQPELLLVFKGTFVKGETIDTLRTVGVRSYCFYPDVSFRTHGPYLPAALSRYDWVFTTKSFGLRDLREQLGMTRASRLDHAFDPDLHRPVRLTEEDLTRYQCDVSFIGTWSPKKEKLLASLASARPNLRLRVWGDQWDRANANGPLAKAIEHRPVVGAEYVRAIAASAINLGILSEQRAGSSAGDQVTSRTFHTAACGGFLLHERTDEVLCIFDDGSSIVCFGDEAELIQRVDEYLGAPDRRHQIAQRGRHVVESKHSWDTRIQDILAKHDGRQ